MYIVHTMYFLPPFPKTSQNQANQSHPMGLTRQATDVELDKFEGLSLGITRVWERKKIYTCSPSDLMETLMKKFEISSNYKNGDTVIPQLILAGPIFGQSQLVSRSDRCRTQTCGASDFAWTWYTFTALSEHVFGCFWQKFSPSSVETTFTNIPTFWPQH